MTGNQISRPLRIQDGLAPQEEVRAQLPSAREQVRSRGLGVLGSAIFKAAEFVPIARHNAGAVPPPSVSDVKTFRLDIEADEIAWAVARFLGARCFAGEVTNVRNTWMESC